MAFADSSPGQIGGLLEHSAKGSLTTVLALVVLVAFVVLTTRSRATKEPQSLWDPIPFAFNTLQFVTNNATFMKRVTQVLKNTNIAKFYLGFTPVYLVSGPQNTQSLFQRSHNVNNEGIMVHSVFPVLYRMSAEEVRRFADDKSGRGRIPAPGTESTPDNRRYWSTYEHVHSEFLGRPHHFKPVIDVFASQFSKALEKHSIGEWTTMSVTNLCRREVTECAIAALLGSKILELNQGFLDAFWEFDDNVFALTLGFPMWLNPRPYRVQDRFLAMIGRYLDDAWASFDWKSSSAEASWEPHFGARVCREIIEWFRGDAFQRKAMTGALGALLFAQNSNSIPTTMWMIIELVKNPSLLQAIREEIATTCFIAPETGARTIDIQKLVTLPLLQSMFVETLRLHMNFNIIRNVKENITLNGFTIRKESMLQAPMLVAHHDEAVWGVAGHPVSEFWAERHLKTVEEKDDSGCVTRKRTFAVAGRPSSFFPFGGGAQICPGRHLAKHEILTTVGLLFSRFDVELVEWTKMDGSPSNRPAQNDQRYCGAGAMPPDRDLKFRCKRIW
ncbi:MAG: hypothetical protein Q9165_006620 [Trypethelium subeluteriae]